MDPSMSHTSQLQQTDTTNKNKNPQNLLSEARKKLKSEHAEATRAVVDPSAEKPPRLTGRQRAKHLKLTPTDDILATVAKTPFEKLTSSQQFVASKLNSDFKHAPHMLKSTHKPAARLDPPPLPPGWTEHKAPTGQPYYHNDSIKQSTYTRPLPNLQLGVQYPNQVTSGITGHSQSGYSANNSFSINKTSLTPGGIGNHPYSNGNSWCGRGNSNGGLANQHKPQPRDRSKLKYDIPGCEPWVLVKTKLGRRFVYNTEKNESFWRIPPDLVKAVNEIDKQEQEKQPGQDNKESSALADGDRATAEAELLTAANGTPTAAPAPRTILSIDQETNRSTLDSDGEDYEEVEVTDDEDETNPSKRQKTEERNVEQPVEFNEEDIELQLAAMGQSYGLDPGEYGDNDGEDLEEGAEGLALTEEDAKALFKDMLNDQGISPYTTWEKVIEAGHIVDDERYTVLPNMRSRKEVWGEWTRDTIQRLKEQREKVEKKDPKIPYMAFLQKNATPKLYWPEFRRKYKKEPEMHNNNVSDKDREKWYRDYISRLKLPEAILKSDLVNLLKSIPIYALNKSTAIDALPTALLTDLRYISLRPTIRDPLIEAHLSTLPAAPIDLRISSEEQEAQAKERQQRQQREEALAERQRQVQEEKRRQNGALRYSKDTLREREEEVQRAMRVGKEGLLGHMAEKQSVPTPAKS